MTFSVDDIVWVNLGKSYGWWPAQVQDSQNRSRMKESAMKNFKLEGGDEFTYLSTSESNCTFVKFFDDDAKERLKIKDDKRIKKYSCKDKLKLIISGFKQLDETKKGGLGGVNLRLAQFYKDVEMAEVMTDNDVRVAAVLARYEVMETDHNEDKNTEEITGNVLVDVTPSSSNKSKKSKNILRQLKNGRIKKTKRKPVKRK